MVDFNSKENWPRQAPYNIDYQAKAAGYAAFWDGKPRKNPYHDRNEDIANQVIVKMLFNSWDMGWVQAENENRERYRNPISTVPELKCKPSIIPDHEEAKAACLKGVATPLDEYVYNGPSESEYYGEHGIKVIEWLLDLIRKYEASSHPEERTIKVSDFVQIKPGPLSSVHFGTTLFKDGEPIGKILSAERVGDVVTGKVKIDDVKPTMEETASAYKFFDAIPINLQPSPESLKIIEALSKKIAEDVSGRLFNETTLDDIIKGVHETMSKSWMRKALPPEQSGITGHMTMSRKSFYVTHLDAAIKGANHAITGAKYDGNYLNDNATIAYDDAYKAVIALIISPSSMNDVMLEAVHQYVVKGRSFYRDIFLQMLKDYAASKYIEGRLEF